MGTAGRSTPLRRTGSLLGLLALELAAVLALHWLGRLAGLRIRWDEPVPWLLSSPVQEVLGALVRTVGLVIASWLLASTVLYLLASLTRLPSAVRAVVDKSRNLLHSPVSSDRRPRSSPSVLSSSVRQMGSSALPTRIVFTTVDHRINASRSRRCSVRSPRQQNRIATGAWTAANAALSSGSCTRIWKPSDL